MIKKIKSITALICVTLIGMSFGLAACSNSAVISGNELSAYKGENKDSNGNTIYNKSLFYSNKEVQGGADPFVLDDTEQTGYYYLYTTGAAFNVSRSKDLCNWEIVGPAVTPNQPTDVLEMMYKCIWAPEVVYDADTELYYMFVGAGVDTDAKRISSILNQVNAGTLHGVADIGLYNMYCMTSTSPTGPFSPISLKTQSAYADINTQTDKELTEEEALSGDYVYTKETDDSGKTTYYEAAFPYFFTEYCYLRPDKYSQKLQQAGVYMPDNKPSATYGGSMDPHPYVDPTDGHKYFFFKIEDESSTYNINLVLPMGESNSWLDPDWSKCEYVTVDGYYTVEDWQNNENYGVSYEGNFCNEGASVIYHEGKYYFTFSVNFYTDSSYQVATAVADNILGPYRKLTEEEGGLLLTTASLDSQDMTGTGHHSFIQKDGKTYIIYHRHVNRSVNNELRYTAIDEVTWIKVKDINDDDLTVPYVNGPTDSLQPLPAFASGYENVAEKATIDCSDADVNVSYLNDGLLSEHIFANDELKKYIGETELTKTSTITLTLDKARELRAIMIYNSCDVEKMFFKIPHIVITGEDGKKYVIRNIDFDVEQYCFVNYEGIVSSITPGAAAFAEFYDLKATKIEITIEVPTDKQGYTVGISEIKLLAKKEG